MNAGLILKNIFPLTNSSISCFAAFLMHYAIEEKDVYLSLYSYKLHRH